MVGKMMEKMRVMSNESYHSKFREEPKFTITFCCKARILLLDIFGRVNNYSRRE